MRKDKEVINKGIINKAIRLLNRYKVEEPYTLYVNENYPERLIRGLKEHCKRLGVRVKVGEGY